MEPIRLCFIQELHKIPKRLPIDLENVKEANKLMEENNILKENVIVHAPYIINLATDDEEKRNFATNFLQEEIKE